MTDITVLIIIIIILFVMGGGGIPNHNLYGDSTTEAPAPNLYKDEDYTIEAPPPSNY